MDGAFDWVETSTGGRFHFSRNTLDFFDTESARGLKGITHLATREAPPHEAFVRLHDTTTCSQLPSEASSRIVFNNTNVFYDRDPLLRWTSSAPRGPGRFDCGGFNCVDFRSVMHHELGHYLGLGHSNVLEDLMDGWPVDHNWVEVAFTQCDADRLRALYAPEQIGNPPVNFGIKRNHNGDIVLADACDVVDDVRIEHLTHELVGNRNNESLLLYPTPVSHGEALNIAYTLSRDAVVRLTLHDVLGREIAVLFEGFQPRGSHQAVTNRLTLSKGSVTVRLQLPDAVHTANAIIIH